MQQNKIDQLNEQAGAKPKLPSIQDNLSLLQSKLKIDLQETEEHEVASTFQRRPQFRINENSRRRFY